LRHLQVLARAPRPVGAPAHAAARAYILGELTALGLAPEIETTTAVTYVGLFTYRAARVQNIVGRLKGKANSKTILLTAHYDSVPTGPGASDDGAGVAALLEIARALQSGPGLNNDVAFLFTDAEEVGLLGANAFAAEHPLMKDVGLVLGFDTRGNGGPALLFETSEGNGQLIQAFAAAGDVPLANSLATEVYKRLPNDTDLTIFKRAGLPALNFAYLDGLTRYHTAKDDLAHLDERSLQHLGTYGLGLTRYFGNQNLTALRAGNAVFFNPLGSAFVYYPVSWALPLTGVGLLLFVGVVALGWQRGLLTPGGVALGLLVLLSSCVAAALLAAIGWSAISAVHRGYNVTPWGDTYNHNYYIAAFLSLTLAVTATLYTVSRRWLSVYNLLCGGLCLWLFLAVLMSLLLPGGSYLLTWSLLFALLGLGVMLLAGGRGAAASILVYSVFALPGVVLFSPLIRYMFTALSLPAVGWIVPVAVLPMALLLPHMAALAAVRRWALPGGAAAVCVGCVLAGLLTAGFDADHPKVNNIFYGLDADAGQAVWASADERTDEWTAQFFPAGAHAQQLPVFYPLTHRTFLTGDATAATLAAPAALLLADDKSGDVRSLRLRLTSSRRAPLVSVYVEDGGDVVAVAVDGKPLDLSHVAAHGGRPPSWELQYYGLPETGAELSLQVRAAHPLKLRVTDRAYGLDGLPGAADKPRPPDMMAKPTQYHDSSLVTKEFTF
jgi:Peptidase family M28